jgi:hypothetical protein
MILSWIATPTLYNFEQCVDRARSIAKIELQQFHSTVYLLVGFLSPVQSKLSSFVTSLFREDIHQQNYYIVHATSSS